MTKRDLLKTVTRWTGFSCAVLTLILGIVHVCKEKPTIKWPDEFTEDINLLRWRGRGFDLAPDVFFEFWAPVIFGILGIALHFDSVNLPYLSSSFLRYFIFNLIMGLFGAIGYEGGLGILISIPIWICCLLSIICFFVSDDQASLELTYFVSIREEKHDERPAFEI